MQYILTQEELDDLKKDTDLPKPNKEKEALLNLILHPRRVNIVTGDMSMMGGPQEFLVLKIEMEDLPMSLQEHYRHLVK